MPSAVTSTGLSETAPQQRDSGWLKANIGSLAIAASIIFAAGVYGFVSSPAFATILMGVAIFLIVMGAAAAVAKSWGWFGMVVAFFVSLAAYAVLFSAIDRSLDQMSAAQSAKAAVSTAP